MKSPFSYGFPMVFLVGHPNGDPLGPSSPSSWPTGIKSWRREHEIFCYLGGFQMDVGQNGRPRGPQMWMSSLVLTIHNFGVPNFDPYPNDGTLGRLLDLILMDDMDVWASLFFAFLGSWMKNDDRVQTSLAFFFENLGDTWWKVFVWGPHVFWAFTSWGDGGWTQVLKDDPHCVYEN